MTPFPRRSLLAMLPAAPALAQPAWRAARPVSLVVPFAAGGTTDSMARLVAGPLAQRLGQPVAVENATGASGNIGAARVARAAPDGHAALLAHVGVLSINRHLFRAMPFDAERDFAPIGLVCTNPMALLVSARSGIADLPALVSRAREGRPLGGDVDGGAAGRWSRARGKGGCASPPPATAPPCTLAPCSSSRRWAARRT